MTVCPIRHPGTMRSRNNIGRIIQAEVALDIHIIAGVKPRSILFVLLIQLEGFFWADDKGVRCTRAALSGECERLDVPATHLVFLDIAKRHESKKPAAMRAFRQKVTTLISYQNQRCWVKKDGNFDTMHRPPVKYSPCQGQSKFAPLKTGVEGSRLQMPAIGG